MTDGVLECSYCHTRETPVWRLGPKGAKTLCNACGIRWKRNRQRIKPKKVPGAKKKGQKNKGVTAPLSPINTPGADPNDNFNGEEHLIHHASRRGGPLPVYYGEDSEEEEESPPSSPPYNSVGTSSRPVASNTPTKETSTKEDPTGVNRQIQFLNSLERERQKEQRKPPKPKTPTTTKASPVKRTKTPASALPASATHAIEPKPKTTKPSSVLPNGKGVEKKGRGRPRVHPPPGTVNPLSVRPTVPGGAPASAAPATLPLTAPPPKPIVRYGHSSGSDLSSDESSSDSDSSRSRSQSRERSRKRKRHAKRRSHRDRHHHHHRRRRRHYSDYSDSDSSSSSESDSDYDSDSSFSSPEPRRRVHTTTAHGPAAAHLEPLIENLDTLTQNQHNIRRRLDEMNGLIGSTSERVGSIITGGGPMPDLITSRDDPDVVLNSAGDGNGHVVVNGNSITSLGDLSSAEVLMAWNSDVPMPSQTKGSIPNANRSTNSNRNHFIAPPKRNITVRHLGASPLAISSSVSKSSIHHHPNGGGALPRDEEKTAVSLNDEDDVDTGGKTIHHLPPPLPPHLQHHLNNHFSLQFGGGSHYLGLLRRGGPGSLTSSLTSSNEGDMTRSLECIESMDSEKEDDLSAMASKLSASANNLPPEQRPISLMSLMPVPSPTSYIISGLASPLPPGETSSATAPSSTTTNSSSNPVPSPSASSTLAATASSSSSSTLSSSPSTTSTTTTSTLPSAAATPTLPKTATVGSG